MSCGQRLALLALRLQGSARGTLYTGELVKRHTGIWDCTTGEWLGLEGMAVGGVWLCSSSSSWRGADFQPFWVLPSTEYCERYRLNVQASGALAVFWEAKEQRITLLGHQAILSVSPHMDDFAAKLLSCSAKALNLWLGCKTFSE